MPTVKMCYDDSAACCHSCAKMKLIVDGFCPYLSGVCQNFMLMRLSSKLPLPTCRSASDGARLAGLGRRIGLDVARGLHFLHSRKIVHFDLKSANILLARDNTAKIADVGLAKIMHRQFLSSLYNVGTFAWSAPEVGCLGFRVNPTLGCFEGIRMIRQPCKAALLRPPGQFPD